MRRDRFAKFLVAFILGFVLILGGFSGTVAAEDDTSEDAGQVYESAHVAATESVLETVYRAYNSTQNKYYESIYEAVEYAREGERIVILSGEHQLTSTLTINKQIQLVGEAASVLKIDVNTGKSGIAIMPGADGTLVEGLEIVKIDNAVPDNRAQELIYIQANNVTITGNKMHGQYELGDNEVARAMVVAAGVTGLEISNNEIFALRQPAYFSGTSGTVKNNYVYGTRGWVVEQGNWNFQGNTWGRGSLSNYVDIAILATAGNQHYNDIVALSKANNDAVVEDQRVTPKVLSIVHVDASAASDSPDGTPTNPYKNIPEAIARVVQGGTVYVAEGTYVVDQIRIQKGLTLKGAGVDKSIIDGNCAKPLDPPGTVRIDGTSSLVTLDGFTLMNAGSTEKGTICLVSTKAPVLIQNCHFVGRGNGNLLDMGIWAYNTAKTAHVTIQDCEFEKLWHGILLELPLGGASVLRNTFHDLQPGLDGEYAPEGLFAFTYGGPNKDVTAPIKVNGNSFFNFSGVSIALGGGYPGQATSKFMDVEIKDNTISALGGGMARPHMGILFRNYGEDAASAESGGVHNATISENKITGTSTSNTYGIWLHGVHKDVAITDNEISGVQKGIAVEERAVGAGFASGVVMRRNSIVGNEVGVKNDSDVPIDASLNYWGHATGPTTDNVDAGDPVVGEVSYDPWYSDPKMKEVASARPVINTTQGKAYSSIQAAIDEASSGDTIKVAAGTYQENVVIRGGKNGLRLTGAGSDKTTIAPVSGRAIALQGYPEGRPISGVEIEGFTLESVDGAALIALSSTPDDEPYTKDLVLRDIVVDQGQFGIILNAVEGVTLEGVHLSNISGTAGALELTGVSGLTATGCTFENNKVAIKLQATREGDVGQGYGQNGDISINESTFLGNEVDIENQDDGVLIDASLNWWGDKSGPNSNKLKGKVSSIPWYLEADMTTQSNQLLLTCMVEGSGSVKVDGQPYNTGKNWTYGDTLELVAEPASGWRFSRWVIGDITDTSARITIKMDGNKTVKAVFTKIPVVIEPSPAPGGPSSGPTLPPVIAPSVTETIEAETGGTVELEDGSAAVVLPPNAVAEDVTVTLAPVTEVTQPTTGMVVIAGKVFEITAETEDGKAVTQFAQPITLTFKLTEEELEEAEVELDDLKVFYWDEKAGAWIALPTRVDPETLTVTAVTDHFMVFAVMAKPGMPALSDIVGHWAEKDVLRLVSLGVVGGYEDGTFRPEAGITREEFAKMVVLAAGLEPDAESELSFADTDEIAEWARGYVSAAVKAGIIQGVGDNRFAPKAPVTRAQAATMIMRSLGQVEASRELTFEDAESIPEWAKAAILGAIEKGIIDGFEDNTFRPDLNCTRAQAAKMLSGLTVVRFED